MNPAHLFMLGACSLLSNSPKTDEAIRLAVALARKVWLESLRQVEPEDIARFKDGGGL